MTDEESCFNATGVRLSNPRPQLEAMETIFKLVDIVNESGLTIADLEQVARVAVASGHEKISIVLSMASIGVERGGKPPT